MKFWRKIYNKGFHAYFDKTSSLFFLKLQYSIKRFFLAQKTLPVPQMNRLKQFCELFSFSVKIFDYKVQKLRICVCDMGVWQVCDKCVMGVWGVCDGGVMVVWWVCDSGGGGVMGVWRWCDGYVSMCSSQAIMTFPYIQNLVKKFK